MEEKMVVNQYLTFDVEKTHYAINVLNIREILEFRAVSRIPKMPAYMRGIINLRGNVVPVIDLKMKFGFEETVKKTDTCIIVTEIQLNDDQIIIGILTDSVSEVIDIEEDKIEPPPNIGTVIDSSFIRGMGKKGNEFIILLNIGKIFNSDEISELNTDKTASV